MDDKRRVQNLLNQSLSGLKENPFLARRVIAKAKGEEPVAKRISTAMVIVLILVILILIVLIWNLLYKITCIIKCILNTVNLNSCALLIVT